MTTVDDVGERARRMSWIGVDYFQALRHHHRDAGTDELRRIPAGVSNILAVRFSNDGRQMAAATGDGCLGVYQVATGHCLQFMTATASASPATALRFRGGSDNDLSVLVAAYTNGHVAEWDYRSGGKIRHIVELDNQILALDYRDDGNAFATAGKDRIVRVYDESTGSLVRALQGHSNRLFAVRFAPADRNLILSGGWDDTVRLWDARDDNGEVGRSIGHIIDITFSVSNIVMSINRIA